MNPASAKSRPTAPESWSLVSIFKRTDQAERITAAGTLLFLLLDAMEEKHLSRTS
ncbi:hypothetical protein [Paenibacillus rhizoplanae]|uniref:Uncharacterized protein n=1 Tax=Paenibacillus rhizoplanae TaxID=1917181 RepID=A0ABW5FCZ0_9BACL